VFFWNRNWKNIFKLLEKIEGVECCSHFVKNFFCLQKTLKIKFWNFVYFYLPWLFFLSLYWNLGSEFIYFTFVLYLHFVFVFFCWIIALTNSKLMFFSFCKYYYQILIEALWLWNHLHRIWWLLKIIKRTIYYHLI
jgi:hypothetical protein